MGKGFVCFNGPSRRFSPRNKAKKNETGILIVDDDALLRFFFREFLGKKDWEVFEAENGEEALSLLEKTTIHLIITDLQMPVMDGLELLRRVKKNPRTRSIPIIMVTANAEEGIREKAIQLGANDFIHKATPMLRAWKRYLTH